MMKDMNYKLYLKYILQDELWSGTWYVYER